MNLKFIATGAVIAAAIGLSGYAEAAGGAPPYTDTAAPAVTMMKGLGNVAKSAVGTPTPGKAPFVPPAHTGTPAYAQMTDYQQRQLDLQQQQLDLQKRALNAQILANIAAQQNQIFQANADRMAAIGMANQRAISAWGAAVNRPQINIYPRWW